MPTEPSLARDLTRNLVGRPLVRVQCHTTLELTTDDGWHLTIEGEYAWHTPDGRSLRTADGDEPRIADELERSLPTKVVSLVHDEQGGMTVEVAAGSLRVSSSTDFESWNLVGPERQRVVSMPGGELAVWS